MRENGQFLGSWERLILGAADSAHFPAEYRKDKRHCRPTPSAPRAVSRSNRSKWSRRCVGIAVVASQGKP